MNALLFERPIRFATGPLMINEEAQDMEDFTYHRPVLATEVIELLAPRPGSLHRTSGECACSNHRKDFRFAGAIHCDAGSAHHRAAIGTPPARVAASCRHDGDFGKQA